MRKINPPPSSRFRLKTHTAAAEIEQLLEFDRYLEKTKQEDQKRLIAAESEKQNVLNLAYDEGFARGQEAGTAAFLDAIQKIEAERNVNLQATIDLVRDCLIRILDELPPAATIEAMVRSVVAGNPDEQNFTLFVHPSRKTEIETVLAKSFGNVTDLAIAVTDDESLAPADYVICTPRSIIDISVKSQVDTLCAAITSQVANSSAGTAS